MIPSTCRSTRDSRISCASDAAQPRDDDELVGGPRQLLGCAVDDQGVDAVADLGGFETDGEALSAHDACGGTRPVAEFLDRILDAFAHGGLMP